MAKERNPQVNIYPNEDFLYWIDHILPGPSRNAKVLGLMSIGRMYYESNPALRDQWNRYLGPNPSPLAAFLGQGSMPTNLGSPIASELAQASKKPSEKQEQDDRIAKLEKIVEALSTLVRNSLPDK